MTAAIVAAFVTACVLVALGLRRHRTATPRAAPPAGTDAGPSSDPTPARTAPQAAPTPAHVAAAEEVACALSAELEDALTRFRRRSLTSGDDGAMIAFREAQAVAVRLVAAERIAARLVALDTADTPPGPPRPHTPTNEPAPATAL